VEFKCPGDVVILDLALNRVSGPIPSLSAFTDLISFDVDSNQLTGSIPSLSTLTSMTGFFVSNNNLSGAMPLPPKPLPSTVRIPYSALCGNFLQSAGNATADAQWDGLSGSKPVNGVPGWLACQRASTVTINPSGIVPVDGTAPTIQPGSWASIFGTNLANTTSAWNGDFPTILGGVSVSVNGKAAYLAYVSPSQINFEAPDDSATGTVQVQVATLNGAAASTVALSRFSPSFFVQADGKHVVGIVQTPGAPGNSGAGYDIIGPSRPVVVGETLVLYGVGFGPTNPTVPAGTPFSGAAWTLPPNPVLITIGGVAVPQSNIQFSGIVSTGLYQLNVAVPLGLASGDQSIVGAVAGITSQSGVLVTIQ
jgi:uncharacterized protein (TIGR03437 family)